MNAQFETVFEALSGISDDALDRSAERLVLAEKQHVAELICHLAEISRRKAHFEWGYPSLFAYCVKRLGLSEGSVALRIHVARVARRVPEVLQALAENRVSLTVAGRLAPHLTPDNAAKLLSDCAGMTRREVEEYLVAFAPRPVFAASVRRWPSSREANGQAGSAPREAAILACDQSSRADQSALECGASGQSEAALASAALARPGHSSATRAGLEAPGTEPGTAPDRESGTELFAAPAAPRGQMQPARPDVYNFRFAAGRRFKEDLERLAEVLGVENPVGNMAMILEKAVDMALDKKDPQRRHCRRLARQRRAKSRPASCSANASARPCPDKVAAAAPAGLPDTSSSKADPREPGRVEGQCKQPVAALGASPVEVQVAGVVEVRSPEPVEAQRAMLVKGQVAEPVEGRSPEPVEGRHIPVEVRERVLERAGHRCEYAGPNGVRCTCRTALQIEHTLPFAVFRTHDERQLKAFCWRHNLLCAEQDYGSDFIRGKIRERRRQRA